MHSLIGFIVEAEDKETALANVEMYLSDSMMNNRRGMDYFSLLAEDEDLRKRWGINEAVYEIDDEETKIHIDELIQINRDEIEKHLKKAIELYEKQPEGWENNIFYHLRLASGSFYGGVLFHYEDPVISWKQIDELREGLDERLKLYVVLVDIHH